MIHGQASDQDAATAVWTGPRLAIGPRTPLLPNCPRRENQKIACLLHACSCFALSAQARLPGGSSQRQEAGQSKRWACSRVDLAPIFSLSSRRRGPVSTEIALAEEYDLQDKGWKGAIESLRATRGRGKWGLQHQSARMGGVLAAEQRPGRLRPNSSPQAASNWLPARAVNIWLATSVSGGSGLLAW